MMSLYTVLKMIHGGVVNDNKHYLKLLLQNKYYIIPSVNVDGVKFIEDQYKCTLYTYLVSISHLPIAYCV